MTILTSHLCLSCVVDGGPGLRSGVPVPVDTHPALLLVAELGRAGLITLSKHDYRYIYLYCILYNCRYILIHGRCATGLWKPWCLLSLSSLLLGGGGDLKNNHNETLQFSYDINLDILARHLCAAAPWGRMWAVDGVSLSLAIAQPQPLLLWRLPAHEGQVTRLRNIFL